VVSFVQFSNNLSAASEATSSYLHLYFSMSTKFLNFFFVVFCVSASATFINIPSNFLNNKCFFIKL
ncbi:hypothetical protein, partial [Bacillus cereus]|uniref:hypothetical protein n=1 Tax=Bacillus cereus TaxID=1396 RepID=UPI0034D79D08